MKKLIILCLFLASSPMAVATPKKGAICFYEDETHVRWLKIQGKGAYRPDGSIGREFAVVDKRTNKSLRITTPRYITIPDHKLKCGERTQ